MASALAIKSAKSALRSQMKKRLSSIPQSKIESQSYIAQESILHSALYNSSHRISIYLSMPSGELSTTHLVESALKDGKQVFIPYLYASTPADRGSDGYLPKRCMDMIKLNDLGDFRSLKRDNWGIPTIPDEGVEEREWVLRGKEGKVKGLDLMVMPGVAFQVGREGEVRRLGHGKGFYDFFLRRLREKVSMGHEEDGGELKKSEGATTEGWPKLVGLALEEQLLKQSEDELPMGEHDQVLDSVVVGDGMILGARESSFTQSGGPNGQ